MSGEAATDEQQVTFHSLTAYTMAKTIEITNAGGLQQTPVTDEHYSGVLVLATMRSIPTGQIPPALVKVEETTIEELKPTQEKIPQFIADIRSVLEDDPLPRGYVAPSQEEKLALGEKLVQKVYAWCEEQEHQYHNQLQGLVSITIKHQSIQACPLNLQLAEYIRDSKISPAVGLMPINRTERVSSGFGNIAALAILGRYETHEVLTGISERQGWYESAIELRIRTQDPLMPICAMVIAIVPASFGLYLLRYSCATQLDQTQKEFWNSDTFSIRTLHAIPFTDKEGVKTLEELQDLFPQLFSFLAESSTARKIYLKSIGVTGQSLL